jgi:hypothetical protein
MGHWESEANQKEFFDSLGAKLGIRDPTHWYLVSRNDVDRNGGAGVLAHYGKSLSQAIMSVYSNHL